MVVGFLIMKWLVFLKTAQGPTFLLRLGSGGGPDTLLNFQCVGVRDILRLCAMACFFSDLRRLMLTLFN